MNKNNKKIKVLHIISGYGGGISSHIRNLATAINPEKVTFDVIGFTDYNTNFIKEIGLTGGKTFTFLKPKKVGFVKFYQHAKSIMQDNGPYDVVLCHIAGHYSLVFKMMSMQVGVKRFVVHAHRTTYDKKSSWTDHLRRKADQIFSNATANQLTSCSTEASLFVFGEKLVHKKQVMHIPNSISVEKYLISLTEEQINQLKKENNIPTDRLIVGNLGRFTLVKNHQFMIKLIESMALSGLKFTWVFIGDGDLESEIKQIVIDKNLSDYVRFLGRREDGNLLYQLMDVFVMTSFSEGLPTVIIEAQASGVPVVLSDTITREVDLGLDMLTYLALNEEIEVWINQIIKSSETNVPSKENRAAAIHDKGFSNTVAANLYEDFLQGKIQSFEIGDSYKKLEQ